jgi:FtsZ-interacting cell division protein ZipA
MSQLQIGLVSLGALIILAVLLFNWWQERNIRRETVRRFDGPIDDVLMEELRKQPQPEATEEFRIDTETVVEISEEVILVDTHVEQDRKENPLAAEPAEALESEPETEPEPAPEPEPEPSSSVEPQPEQDHDADEIAPEPIQPGDTQPVAPIAGELPPMADPQIDEIAIITPAQPCSGSMIRDALQPLPVFQKTVRWLGQDASGASYPLTKEQEQTRFNRIISTLQLADRSGPANGEDLRNFHAKVEDLATRISGEVEWREHGDPLQYARDLDQFCIDVDVMISLQLNAGAGASFAGTKLRGLAEAGGLVLKDDGQFHCLNDAGESLFVLACLERRALTPDVLRTVLLRGVVLMMDVPRVANGVEVFNQMVLLGRKLEAALSIKLMDENQHLLGDADIEKIRQQLKVIYSKMHARGVSPGDTTALRLFS